MKKFIDLNDMVHEFLFNMTTDMIVNVMMHVICRNCDARAFWLPKSLAFGGQSFKRGS